MTLPPKVRFDAFPTPSSLVRPAEEQRSSYNRYLFAFDTHFPASPPCLLKVSLSYIAAAAVAIPNATYTSGNFLRSDLYIRQSDSEPACYTQDMEGPQLTNSYPRVRRQAARLVLAQPIPRPHPHRHLPLFRCCARRPGRVVSPLPALLDAPHLTRQRPGHQAAHSPHPPRPGPSRVGLH